MNFIHAYILRFKDYPVLQFTRSIEIGITQHNGMNVHPSKVGAPPGNFLYAGCVYMFAICCCVEFSYAGWGEIWRDCCAPVWMLEMGYVLLTHERDEYTCFTIPKKFVRCTNWVPTAKRFIMVQACKISVPQMQTAYSSVMTSTLSNSNIFRELILLFYSLKL